MKYTRSESATQVVLTPATKPTAAVIWLHGLGADGNDFVPIVPELRLPDTLAARFIFPHAQERPVTINNGYVMRAWYDIKALALSGAEDEVGIRESESEIAALIQEQLVDGIAANKIVVAGFSQGGAIALQTALRYPQRLAGIMALSTYLPLRATLAAEASQANRDVPILMCHGTQDSVVPMRLGELSRDALNGLGYPIEWHAYAMEHSVCAEEVVHIGRWLAEKLS